MKGFYIDVSNNLLDPKHYKKMKESVWLFMWFLDKITRITNEHGKVLGGKPIKFEDVNNDLGISRSLYQRWVKRLSEEGYIKTLRTPYGNCITVLKAQKRFRKDTPKSTDSANSNESDVSEMTHVIRCVENDTSLPLQRCSDLTHQCLNSDTSLPKEMFDSDTSKIRHSQIVPMGHNQKDNTIFCKTSFAGTKKSGVKKNTSLKTNGNTTESKTVDRLPRGAVPRETPENTTPSNGALVNEAIALFLPILPGDFIGKRTAFAKPPTREAVEELLKRYSISDLKELIRKYDAKKADKFRPEVGTVYEFCTIKLAKIESFVAKEGGLWAQKSISTPEYRAEDDKRIRKGLEARREKTWERVKDYFQKTENQEEKNQWLISSSLNRDKWFEAFPEEKEKWLLEHPDVI